MSSPLALKTMMAAAAATTAALTLGVGPASAACTLSIEPAQDQWVVRYNPYEDDAVQQRYDVAVVNTGTTDCVGSMRVDLRGEAYGMRQAGGQDRVAYALIDERSGADVTPRSGQGPRRFGAQPVRLAPGERGLIRFALAAAPEGDLARGFYSQTAYLSVIASDGEPMAERPVTLGVEVAASAVMGLKGEFQRSQGTATVDLGELSSGRRDLNTSLYVKSTGGYRVSVSSANRGRLRLANSNWYVDYRLALGAENMDLAQVDTLEVVSRRARNDSYPLAVSIGDVAGKRAGAYRDTLTFTVAAL